MARNARALTLTLNKPARFGGILLLSLALGACGGGDSDPKPQAEPTPAPIPLQPTGFGFTKIASNGQPLAIQNASWNWNAAGSEAAGTKWDCVRDNLTGLVWENKSDDNGLRDKDWIYTWYHSDNSKNGGNAGTPNGGTCANGTGCDTEKFVKAVNTAGLCGYNDWRMPSLAELKNIVDLERVSPAIDPDFFPTTLSSWYWSASPRAANADDAWNVDFYDGNDYWGNKSNGYSVRLVRGQ